MVVQRVRSGTRLAPMPIVNLVSLPAMSVTPKQSYGNGSNKRNPPVPVWSESVRNPPRGGNPLLRSPDTSGAKAFSDFMVSQKTQAIIGKFGISKYGSPLFFPDAGKKDIQTFKFVADAMGVSLDTVARWFIVSIIFVFDPLAICLILAYNVAVFRREDIEVYDKPVETLIKPIDLIPEEKPVDPVITPTEPSPAPEPPPQPPSPAPEPPPAAPSNDSFFNQYFKR